MCIYCGVIFVKRRHYYLVFVVTHRDGTYHCGAAKADAGPAAPKLTLQADEELISYTVRSYHYIFKLISHLNMQYVSLPKLEYAIC